MVNVSRKDLWTLFTWQSLNLRCFCDWKACVCVYVCVCVCVFSDGVGLKTLY